MDERTDGQVDRCQWMQMMGGHTDERMKDGPTDGWTGRADELIGRWVDGWMGGREERQLNGRTYRWTDWLANRPTD